MVKAPGIPPVLVLSTGRCGSTMVSNMLNPAPPGSEPFGVLQLRGAQDVPAPAPDR